VGAAFAIRENIKFLFSEDICKYGEVYRTAHAPPM